MKELDRVRIIKERKEFVDLGVHVGDEGIIMLPKRDDYWLVIIEGEVKQDENGEYYGEDDIYLAAKDEDIELI